MYSSTLTGLIPHFLYLSTHPYRMVCLSLFPCVHYTALFLHPSSSRQVHSIKSVELFLTFLRRIFIRRTLRPLHQSVNLLSKPVFSLLFCQIFPFHLFCNNHTNKPIILIATCTIIYSFFMMSTRQNISNFRPLLNATQINAVISINVLLHKT